MKILLLFVLPLLVACQSIGKPIPYDSPRSVPPVESVFELHRSLIVSRGTSRTYIQFGAAKNYKAVNVHEPWCQFRLYEPREALKEERIIHPDRFRVVRSSQSAEWVAAYPIVLASSSMLFPREFRHDDPGPQTLATIMKLQSDSQPHVFELQCAIFDDPRSNNFVSVKQIQQTLGGLVSLHLK